MKVHVTNANKQLHKSVRQPAIEQQSAFRNSESDLYIVRMLDHTKAYLETINKSELLKDQNTSVREEANFYSLNIF